MSKSRLACNLPGFFRTFDSASPDAHRPRRYTTTVPKPAPAWPAQTRTIKNKKWKRELRRTRQGGTMISYQRLG